MARFEKQEVLIPEAFIMLAYYGDENGLTEEEIQAFDQLIEEKIKGAVWHYGNYKHEGFCHTHDMRKYGVLPANCILLDIMTMQ